MENPNRRWVVVMEQYEKYDIDYSRNLPPTNDFLANRNTLFEKSIKELRLHNGDRILEIGCDKGNFVLYLQKKFGKDNVFGIDLNKEAISAAKIQNLLYMDALHTTFSNGYFTKIFSFHTIEHIPDLSAFFKEVDRILAPGGICVMGYPAEPIRGLFSVRMAMKYYGNPLLARKIHVHKLYPRKLRKFVMGTSLRIVKSKLIFALLPQFYTVLSKPSTI
ncbi:MAG TPA: methyltransferase domain-containing protein [Candidatus Nanoarchaeia archaeon]|nr:methyltransferase domain-containing protein [Candidatus Nanoarchaeia archaeon]